MSYILFGHDLSVNFIVGVSIVLISMHQFFSYGDPKGAKGESKSSESISSMSPDVDREAPLPQLGDIEMRGQRSIASSLHEPHSQINSQQGKEL